MPFYRIVVCAVLALDLNSRIESDKDFLQPLATKLERKDMAYSTEQVKRILVSAAQKYNVDPKIVLAIAQHESGFRPGVNNAGLNKNGTTDWGLMQLNDITLKTYGLTPEQALDPVTNAEYGVRLLKSNLDRFGGDVDKAIWGYAAGPGNVKGTPPAAVVNYQNYVRNYKADPNIWNAPIDAPVEAGGGGGGGEDGSGGGGWENGSPSIPDAGNPVSFDLAGEDTGLVVLAVLGVVGIWIATS
jgi:hypothetical protein